MLMSQHPVTMRAVAERALTRAGYDVTACSDGEEGLAAVANGGEFDLVVSDVVMPEMDGPTLMKHLRSERPEVKIIFISGYAEDAFRRNLSDNEEFMFLQKPFDLKELAAAVKAALQG